MLNIENYEKNKEKISQQGQNFCETIKNISNIKEGFLLNVTDGLVWVNKDCYSKNLTSWFWDGKMENVKQINFKKIVIDILDELKKFNVLNYKENLAFRVEANQIQLKIF